MRTYPIVLVMVALFSAPAPGRAVTIDPPPFDALLRDAGFVFEGEVQGVDPDAGGSRGARSRVSMRVTRVLAGRAAAAGEPFTFELPEGRLPDGRFVEIVESPRFVPGERYLVFYTRRVWYNTPVVGWHYGLLRRVGAGSAAVYADQDGRCVSGFNHAGAILGPRVAEPQSALAGWPSAAAVAPPDPSPYTETDCLPASAVRAMVKSRLSALRLQGTDDVQREPADGAWVLDPIRGGTR